MLYLDTALFVAAVTAEDATPEAQRWLRERQGDIFAFSGWVTTEVSAALSIKVRTGDLTARMRAEAEAAYHVLLQHIVRLDIAASHFDRAAELARIGTTGLRGGDALHLAVASAYDATLCTLDKRFALACERLSLPFNLIG